MNSLQRSIIWYIFHIQMNIVKEYQSWLVVVAIVALGDAPKGAPVRVEAKVVVRWLLLIAWRYKLSQAE